MNYKLGCIGLCLFLFAITGCVGNRTYLEEDCENGICTSNQEYRAVCTETPDGYSVCEEAPTVGDVNYTRTQADYRKYGERSPRDRHITQAGAGNNISAVVPPSIDDEVLDYEEEVMIRNGKANRKHAPYNNSSNVANNNSMSHNPVQPQDNVDPATAAAYAQMGEELPTTEVVEEEVEEENTVEDTGASEEEEDLNKDWLAEEGQSLKELLTAWSEESGWRLIWKTNRNYTLNAGAMFRGNFADVSSALIRAFARARPAPIATFYKGNRVLVIETMEDENAYD